MSGKNVQLARISARGVVQGVGFRPFVYGLAKSHRLTGWVCNTSEDVKIEVEGEKKALDRFIADLEGKAPPLAHIESLSISFTEPRGYMGFEIRRSEAQPGQYQLVSPDIATCAACLNDVLTEGNRRYRYPFTNCTNCGPRFTIIRDIPYDRPLTTMSVFNMCRDCRREYEDPLNRRFHAQPNACPTCGPQLQMTDNSGQMVKCGDIIQKTAQLLREGHIIAIKGLGGFLLACDAENTDPVMLLRQRKHRPSKPFAVMLQDMDEVRKHCEVTSEEEVLLVSPQSPIVLLLRKPGSTICNEVGPNLKYLGVMLPYTPLHHLILRRTGLPLVMTSGNVSEEPIAGQNAEALQRLGNIADYFLMHNRDIYSTYDDSVTMVVDNQMQVVRRARGYAPYPIHLGFTAPQVLACGAEEKNTFCLTRDNHAFVSQHIGDMENLETLEHYERTLELYKKLFRIQPEIIAYDLHPEYLPTKFALEQIERDQLKGIGVQHHHAHIASCLADNSFERSVIGIAFDGTGYGTDGKIWGGEFMIANDRDFKRVGQLEYMPLPGGSLAIRKPYRTALGYLLALGCESAWRSLPGLLNSVDSDEAGLIQRQVMNDINSPLTSSMGRLFDAVSALTGIRGVIDYEAQAAIELEMRALEAQDESGYYPVDISIVAGYQTVKLQAMLGAIIDEIMKDTQQAVIAMKFHNTVAKLTQDVCHRIREESGLRTVALSGGCFQNRLLLMKVIEPLRRAGFTVLTHHKVPTNDGGISLGQAIIAARSK